MELKGPDKDSFFAAQMGRAFGVSSDWNELPQRERNGKV